MTMSISSVIFGLLKSLIPFNGFAVHHAPLESRTSANSKAPKTGPFAIPFVAGSTQSTCTNAISPTKFTPLRVVRVIERGQSRSNVGRMVISGRMADVCAELDRLAACEAA